MFSLQLYNVRICLFFAILCEFKLIFLTFVMLVRQNFNLNVLSWALETFIWTFSSVFKHLKD